MYDHRPVITRPKISWHPSIGVPNSLKSIVHPADDQRVAVQWEWLDFCPPPNICPRTHVLSLIRFDVRFTFRVKTVKVAHTRLPSVRFRSLSRLLAASLQVTWVINPAVGCQYFSPEARWAWTVCLTLLPDSVAAAIWTQALLRLQSGTSASSLRLRFVLSTWTKANSSSRTPVGNTCYVQNLRSPKRPGARFTIHRKIILSLSEDRLTISSYLQLAMIYLRNIVS